MQAHRTNAVVREDGSVVISQTPFKAGERVDVIVLSNAQAANPGQRYPLRGRPYRYDDPTEPVGVEDWEAMK